jgi:hypothetical protein
MPFVPLSAQRHLSVVRIDSPMRGAMKKSCSVHLGSVVALGLLLAGCGAHEAEGVKGDGGSPSDRKSAVGKKLQEGIQGAIKLNMGVSLVDATSQHRYIDLESAERYIICFERPVPEMLAVKFYVVPVSARCPRKIDGDGAISKVPSVVGDNAKDAMRQMMYSGYAPEKVRFYVFSDRTRRVKVSDVGGSSVCDQQPREGVEMKPAGVVKLYVGTKCR